MSRKYYCVINIHILQHSNKIDSRSYYYLVISLFLLLNSNRRDSCSFYYSIVILITLCITAHIINENLLHSNLGEKLFSIDYITIWTIGEWKYSPKPALLFHNNLTNTIYRVYPFWVIGNILGNNTRSDGVQQVFNVYFLFYRLVRYSGFELTVKEI